MTDIPAVAGPQSHLADDALLARISEEITSDQPLLDELVNELVFRFCEQAVHMHRLLCAAVGVRQVADEVFAELRLDEAADGERPPPPSSGG